MQEDVEYFQDQIQTRKNPIKEPLNATEILNPPAPTNVRASVCDAATDFPSPGIVSPTSPTAGTRTNIDLIREIIASSNYEWTTIGRIMKKTGLSQDEILHEARKEPTIVIGYGRQTKNFLFKFDPIKSVLSDAEWMRNPNEKARKEARKVIDEFAAARQNRDDL